jgi:hypothetical protein
MNTICARMIKALSLAALISVAVIDSSAATFTGGAVEVASNVVHPTGNIYDQLLVNGVTVTAEADPGQVLRLSFIDLNDDIVQVEFTGAGSLTLTLDAVSGPALAKRYNQPGVLYMKGHAVIEIEGSDASSQLAVFSVGTANAVNAALFRAGEMYDGIADLALVHIKPDPINPNGSAFGGLRLGNVHFWRARDRTGIYAPNVHVQGGVRVHNVTAYDDATPVIWFGRNSQFGSVEILGGDLVQPNAQPIGSGSYVYSVNAQAGATSHGVPLPRQSPRAQLIDETGKVTTLRQDDGGWWNPDPTIPISPLPVGLPPVVPSW